MRIQKLNKDTKQNLLEDLLKRSPNSYGQYEASVQSILNEVKEKKDEAVFAFTRKFDGAEISADNILVTEAEIEEACQEVDASLLDVIRKARNNIENFHAKQRQNSWFDSKPDGTILGQKVTPLHRVGVYVPGGKAVYPSSVLMNIVPAKVAGVKCIQMATPVNKEGKIRFKHSCVMCMRCSFYCPKNAIDIGFLQGWKVTSYYSLDKYWNEVEKRVNFIKGNEKGFYKCFIEYFKDVDKMYNSIDIKVN